VDTAERWNAPIAVWLLICLALAYVPDMGHGFIADDFGWILHSRVRGPGDLARLFTTAPMGFYRPVVSLSFLLNEPMAGLTSIAYGLVNLALVLAVAGAIVTLCQVLGLGGGYGLFAAGVWTFNIHGVGMALTWISGRTSLLATLFAVLAAIAFTRQRRGMAGLWTGLAVLSKEEPILLPMVFIVWTAVERQPSRTVASSCPSSISKSSRDRPRVECSSSRVARYDGHMTRPSFCGEWHFPTPTQRRTARWNEPSSSG